MHPFILFLHSILSEISCVVVIHQMVVRKLFQPLLKDIDIRAAMNCFQWYLAFYFCFFLWTMQSQQRNSASYSCIIISKSIVIMVVAFAHPCSSSVFSRLSWSCSYIVHTHFDTVCHGVSGTTPNVFCFFFWHFFLLRYHGIFSPMFIYDTLSIVHCCLCWTIFIFPMN